jgi:hypothetical protein
VNALKFVCIAIIYFTVWFGVYLGFVDIAPKWGYHVPGWLVGAVALVQISSACFVAYRYAAYRNTRGAIDPVGFIVSVAFLIAAVIFSLFSSAIFWIALYGM